MTVNNNNLSVKVFIFDCSLMFSSELLFDAIVERVIKEENLFMAWIVFSERVRSLRKISSCISIRSWMSDFDKSSLTSFSISFLIGIYALY